MEFHVQQVLAAADLDIYQSVQHQGKWIGLDIVTKLLSCFLVPVLCGEICMGVKGDVVDQQYKFQWNIILGA